jgi:GTP-binding protein
MLNYQNVQFIKSAAETSGFISDGLPQVVFAGKSNVGKSSVINRLLNRKNFARVGATPGKTVHVNYFKIDNRIYFVDLPGYGYAKVSAAEKARWGKLMEAFFADGDKITLGVLIVDARHVPTADDILMARWFAGTGRPVIVAANKADKLSKAALEESLETIKAALPPLAAERLLAFSAEKGTNRDTLISEIEKITR